MRERVRGMATFIVIFALCVLLAVLFRHSDKSSISDGFTSRVDGLYRVEPIENKVTKVREYSIKHIDLNRATRAELVSVYGIGEVLSGRIMEYREALGGYYSVEQLHEVRGIDKGCYDKIFRNFFVKDSAYSKIYVNFATLNELIRHPYISQTMARRIVAARKRGGYFTTTKELIDNDILLPSEALRVAPYCCFSAAPVMGK